MSSSCGVPCWPRLPCRPRSSSARRPFRRVTRNFKEDCVSPRVQRLLPDALLASADRDAAKIVVIADGARYSYGALVDQALRLARALQDNGVRRGDRVAIYLDNSWHAVVAVYGTLLSGGVLTFINPQTKAEKLAFVLADSEASVLVTERSLAPVFLAALGDAPNVRCVISSGGLPDDSSSDGP